MYNKKHIHINFLPRIKIIFVLLLFEFEIVEIQTVIEQHLVTLTCITINFFASSSCLAISLVLALGAPCI